MVLNPKSKVQFEIVDEFGNILPNALKHFSMLHNFFDWAGLLRGIRRKAYSKKWPSNRQKHFYVVKFREFRQYDGERQIDHDQ